MRIFDLWLACWTQGEIAEELSVTQGEISKSIPNGNVAELNKNQKAVADHATDFDVPIYNVWRFKERSDHFSRPLVLNQYQGPTRRM